MREKMATIRPFKSLRPDPKYAQQVASVPYDVVNRQEAEQLVAGNPYSFLRVIRSEVELPATESPYSQTAYNKAREKLLDFIRDGILIEDPDESIYLYQQQLGDHIQTGIACCSAVDDYDNSLIKLHEKTRPQKEDDRTKHLLTLGAHQGPVFLTYMSQADLNEAVSNQIQQEPLYEVTAEDGVVHRVWKANNSKEICSLFEKVPCTYVADGHHRAASASRARANLRQNNPGHTGQEAYNFFLTVIFPHDQVSILAYNRVIKKSDLDAEGIIKRISEICPIEESGEKTPKKKGQVCMFLDGRWYSLELSKACKSPDDPVSSLDCSVLQTEVLSVLFGVDDPRTSNNVDFIGGARGTQELERLVNSGEACCAFSMFPVSIEELISVSDSGKTMPPKSTWFEPKLRSGLFVHPFSLEE
jgi:uncharacterized protein (DUF1015 family)